MVSGRSPQIAQRLVDAYITGLRQRLPTLCIRRLDQLPGATEQQLLKLRQAYPATPAELLYLLQRVNGTYWEAIRANRGGGSSGADASASPSPIAAAGGPSVSASSSLSPAAAATRASGAKMRATAAAASFVKSALTGPARKPVSKERIAVPILGSALGSCPYFLNRVEDIIAPSQQPFPPKRKTAPRQPVRADTSSSSGAAGGEEGGRHRCSDGHRESEAPALQQHPGADGRSPTSSTAAVGGRGHAADRDGVQPPCSASIEAIYANLRVVRGFPPGTDGGDETSGNPSSAAAAAALGVVTRPVGGEDYNPNQRVVYVDPRISVRASFERWLAFADSMLPHHQPWGDGDGDGDGEGEGESARGVDTREGAASRPVAQPRKASVSRLYIDFAPDEVGGGVSGQIIQYSRGEPESFRVIARSFDEYLRFLMSEEYEFTEELDDEDEDDDRSKGADGGDGARPSITRPDTEAIHASAAESAGENAILSSSGQPIPPPPPSSAT